MGEDYFGVTEQENASVAWWGIFLELSLHATQHFWKELRLERRPSLYVRQIARALVATNYYRWMEDKTYFDSKIKRILFAKPPILDFTAEETLEGFSVQVERALDEIELHDGSAMRQTIEHWYMLRTVEPSPHVKLLLAYGEGWNELLWFASRGFDLIGELPKPVAKRLQTIVLKADLRQKRLQLDLLHRTSLSRFTWDRFICRTSASLSLLIRETATREKWLKIFSDFSKSDLVSIDAWGHFQSAKFAKDPIPSLINKSYSL